MCLLERFGPLLVLVFPCISPHLYQVLGLLTAVRSRVVGGGMPDSGGRFDPVACMTCHATFNSALAHRFCTSS
eukprot:1743566-Amphidinium_carterae.1